MTTGVIYTIDQFKQDIDSEPRPWYLQALNGEWPDNQIDYWNFNSCVAPELRPAIVTRAEADNCLGMNNWELGCEYKGYKFWIPIN